MPDFRTTRFQFLSLVMPPAAPKPRPKVVRTRRSPRHVPRWAYEFNWDGISRGGFVEAFTRSEARARIKEKLGINKKGRVPIGAVIERLPDPRMRPLPAPTPPAAETPKRSWLPFLRWRRRSA